MPVGTVTVPFMVGAARVVNEKLEGVPSGFSAAFLRAAPTVTV